MVFNGLEENRDSMYLGLNAGNTCRCCIKLTLDGLIAYLKLNIILNILK